MNSSSSEDNTTTTANGGADLLSNDQPDAPNSNSNPPPQNPSPHDEKSSSAAAAAIVSEAVPSTPSFPTPHVNKPSIATVSAIVNEVIRQKETGSNTATLDVSSIATQEVDKFYEDGRLEVEEGTLPPPGARPPSRSKHPWNMSADETKALFGTKGTKKASAILSSKIKAALGGRNSGRGSGSKTNIDSQTAADRMEQAMQNMTSNEMNENNPDFNDLCEELGITPQSHPQLRSPYRTFNTSLERLCSSTTNKCNRQYCLIVTCLVSIAILISSAVSKGYQHATKRNDELHPKWIKEQQEEEGDKKWWIDRNKDGILDSTEMEPIISPQTTIDVNNNKNNKLSKEELDQLYYKLEDEYLPIWFDRSMGWKGTTYGEAIVFCAKHDNFIPCPYEVYCPGDGHQLIFDEVFQDVDDDGQQQQQLSWAPIIDNWNEWVQVGSGGRQCTAYSGVYKQRPTWGGGEEDGEKLTRHIMCCLSDPLLDDDNDDEEESGSAVPIPPNVEKEHGDDVDDPLPPPPPGASDEDDSTEPILTALDLEVKNTYHPFWFNVNDGWNGGTYEEGKAFCESIPNGENSTFHLCPIKAVCPNGDSVEKPLTYQTDAFEGVQWTPISNNHNGWVLVGKISEERPDTCQTYLELYHTDPGFGMDGSQPEIKEHILCCQVESGYDGGIKKEDIAIATSQGQSPILPIASEIHTSAGNPEPMHAAGEHNYDSLDTITAMKMTLKPIWYSSDYGGWSGGTYDDAWRFCDEQDQELCPAAAVCPNGPTFPPLDGAHISSKDESSDSWVPVINDSNEWVSTGTANTQYQCIDYKTLNGKKPDWGLDGSEPGLKRHILCCTKTSSLVHNNPLQDEATDTDADTVMQSASSHTITSELPDNIEEDDDEKTISGTWFHVSNGWNSGSHDDAEHFCAIKEVNRKRMQLCSYDIYCPSGPTQNPAAGREVNDDEEVEQWAPTSDDDNSWVMVGMNGHNRNTQCLTHTQLEGSAPSWGLDGSNKEKKQYIMCCLDHSSK